MKKIIHCCLKGETLEILKEIPDSEFILISELELYEFFLKKNSYYDGLVLGEKVNSPISIAQKVYSTDNAISVLILANSINYLKYKQALKFTPFIGNTIQCFSSEKKSDLLSHAQEVINKTSQRRNYSKMKSAIQISTINKEEDYIKKEYLDKYLEKAPIGAVLLDNEGLIMAANECALEIFEVKENGMLGTNLSLFFNNETRTDFDKFLLQDFKINSLKTFERKKNETLQFLEIIVAQIEALNSKHKIAIINDITEKVLFENQVKNQIVQLEDLNAKLNITNENLLKTNKELDSFIYTASHDLKAPILNIEGLVRVLEKEFINPTPKIKQIISLMLISIERFKETIVDLTEISNIQQQLGEDIKEIDISELIEEIKSLISGIIDSTQTEIETDVKIVSRVKFSKKNLKSIIYNLLTNSIKYRLQGVAPKIQIKTFKKEGYIGFVIKDNGMGFSTDKKDKIFEMFKRLHNHVEGTGVGLYIVKKIVDNTRGKIEVESSPGNGSTFTIYLKEY